VWSCCDCCCACVVSVPREAGWFMRWRSSFASCSDFSAAVADWAGLGRSEALEARGSPTGSPLYIHSSWEEWEVKPDWAAWWWSSSWLRSSSIWRLSSSSCCCSWACWCSFLRFSSRFCFVPGCHVFFCRNASLRALLRGQHHSFSSVWFPRDPGAPFAHRALLPPPRPPLRSRRALRIRE